MVSLKELEEWKAKLLYEMEMRGVKLEICIYCEECYVEGSKCYCLYDW